MKTQGKLNISLTWRLLSAVSMNERANQSGFSTLSVNGIKSCGSSVIVSFIKSYAYEFHKKIVDD